MSVLGTLTSELAARKEAREADFKKIVLAIADGKRPDVEAVEEALGGRPIEDIDKAVKRIIQRREWRAMAERVTAAEAEIAEAHKLMKPHDEALALAQRQHAAARSTVDRRIADAAERVAAGKDALRKLKSSATAEAVAAFSAAIEARAEMHAKLRDAREAVARLVLTEADLTAARQQLLREDERAAFQKDLDSCAAMLVRARRDAATAEADYAESQKQVDAAERQLLVVE